MQVFQKLNQRILMMARRRETNDGEPGLPVSVQSDLFGNLFVNLVPALPPGGDPGNYIAVDLDDDGYAFQSPTYAFPTASFLYGSTGAAFPNNRMEQIRLVTAANAASALQEGVIAVAPPVQWSVTDAPAGNVLSSATRAAQGANTRNIVQGATFTLSGLAASIQDIIVRIRNGAGGPILWQSYIFKDAGTNSVTINLSGLSLACSDNTAAVAEFSAAGGDPSSFESISLWGITVG